MVPSSPPTAGRENDPLLGLVREMIAGNHRATQQLVLAVGPSVLRVVRKVLGARHPDVEDVAQTALMAALEALVRFRGESTVLHFIWRITLLTAMNARRKLRIRLPADGLDPEQEATDEPTPMIHALATTRRRALRQLLDELPPAQAEVLGLHCILGYTLQETAQASGVPVNTVRSRLITAKCTLRGRLAQDPELYDLLRASS